VINRQELYWLHRRKRHQTADLTWHGDNIERESVASVESALALSNRAFVGRSGRARGTRYVLTSTAHPTLPRKMWDAVSMQIDPTLAAVSTAMVAMSVLVLLVGQSRAWTLHDHRHAGPPGCRMCTLLVYKLGLPHCPLEGPMDFGLFVACHRFDESPSTPEVYEQALEMVEFADQAGFRIAWFPEHHLIHYISCPSPLMMAVKAASRTTRIRLGTAILVIPYYNPLRLAGELGMADILTGGRLEIGVGRGAFEYEFDRFGIDEHIAAARLRDGMAVVQGLLTQDDFSYKGETCSFGPATAVPKPLQTPHPPIWVAARSPDTIKWAIGNGYNLLSTPWREPFARVETLYR